MGIAKKVLEHPVLTLCTFALIAIVAAFTLGNLQIDLLPKMDTPAAMVMTVYENAGPESVEKSVTNILENGLGGLSGLKKMTSESSEGVSLITLKFNYGTNLDSAVNDIRDKLDMVKGNLPKGAQTPRIYKYDSSSSAIMTLSLNGAKSADELRRIAEKSVKDTLEQTAGVAQVSVSGGRKSIVRVEISQNRLEAYGLTLSSVCDTLSMQNIDLGGGSVFEGSKKYMVRTSGEFGSIEEINSTVVGSSNGYAVTLSDIGKAEMGYKDVSSNVYINGKPGVYVEIKKQSGSNAVNVVDGVYEKMEELKAILPEGVSLSVIYDDSAYIRSTLRSLIESITEGFVLTILILFLFLRSVKSTLIMAISIPFSVLITVLLMAFTGITMNMITMTGLILGVGMVVDASVVVIENIYSYRNRGNSAEVSAAIGTNEVMASVVSGNLTTICVFIPFFVFKSKLGVTGELFTTLMIVIITALVSSLFVAMFLVPVLAGKFLRVDSRKEKPLKNQFLKKADEAIEGAIQWLSEKYANGLKCVLHHRFVTVIACFTILVVSVLLFRHLNISFMNYADNYVILHVNMPLGTKLSETENVLNSFYKIIKDEVKGYDSIIVSSGSSGDDLTESSPSYKGTITVNLPQADKQIDNAEAVKEKLRPHFADFPTATFSFDPSFVQQMMENSSDINVSLRGSSLEDLLSVATALKNEMDKNMSEVSETKIDLEKGLPQVEIKINRERAASFGITAAAIATEVNYCINGTTATVYHSNGDDYDVILLFQDNDRSDIIDLENIFVEGAEGRYAVSNFAQIVRNVGPVTVRHDTKNRVVHVTAALTGDNDAQTVEAKIKTVLEQKIIVPNGVYVSFDGSWKETLSMMKTFVIIIILAVLLVFGVMAGTYESFKDPFINMFTLPFLIVGVVLIHLITGDDFGVVSMIGVIMLVGIVVNNGIILVDQTNLLVRRGEKVIDACVSAGRSRFRPVMMTTLTTIIGMIPMAFFADSSSSLTQPIGLCVIGGLSSSTLVTLFIIPVLYSLFNQKLDKRSEFCVPKALKDEIAKVKAEKSGKDICVQIFANQSVQDLICEHLCAALPDFQYSIVPLALGKGGEDYKLGNTTWPETNIILMSYCDESDEKIIQAVISYLKKTHENEGIKLFILHDK